MESRFHETNEVPIRADEGVKFVHHAEAVWQQRDPYGPPGMPTFSSWWKPMKLRQL